MTGKGAYILNIVLIFCSLIYIVPNLSLDISEYQSETKVLSDSRVEEREYYRKFRSRVDRTLFLIMTDGTEWKISDQYSDYWERLKDSANIGKTYKLFMGNNTSLYHNPVQIEIEGEVVYALVEGRKWAYLLIVLTIGLTIYNGLRLMRG